MSKDKKAVAKALKESKGMTQPKKIAEAGMPPHGERQPAVHKTGTSKTPAPHPELVKAKGTAKKMKMVNPPTKEGGSAAPQYKVGTSMHPATHKKICIEDRVATVKKLQEQVKVLRRGSVQLVGSANFPQVKEAVENFNKFHSADFRIAKSGMLVDKSNLGNAQMAKRLGTYLMREGIQNKTAFGPSFAVLLEADLEQAEVILAAKEISDTLQKMVEDLAALGPTELMPIIDEMKVTFGTDKAASFEQAINGSLEQALMQLRQTKDTMTNEILRLEGKEVPGATGAALPGGVPDMGAGMEPEVNPADADFAGGAEGAEGAEEPVTDEEPGLGREKKAA